MDTGVFGGALLCLRVSYYRLIIRIYIHMKKITTENTRYLKYTSEYVLVESGISGNAYKL